MDETEIHIVELGASSHTNKKSEEKTKALVVRNAPLRTKRAKEPIVGILLFLVFFLVCLVVIFFGKKGTIQFITLEGEGLGRNYKIQYRTKGSMNYQQEVDSLFSEVRQALDRDIEDSEVARFNHYTCDPFYYHSPLFYPLLAKSKEIYSKSQGAFDPTLAPVVDLWKKKLKKGSQPSHAAIRSLQEYVGLDYIVANEKRVKRLKEGVQIDLNSLIPSYAVDIVSNFLQSKGVKDLYIELGNETIAFGTDSSQGPWQRKYTVADGQAIVDPLFVNVKLGTKALSIARRHMPREKEQNTRFILDPRTGYPPTGNIIAAFVFANDCITANAYATALMTKNFTSAMKMLTKAEHLDVFLIYRNDLDEIKFYNSPGLQIQHEEDSQEINIATTSEIVF